MKKKKIFFLAAILVLIALLSPRLIILSWASWKYYHTDTICHGKIPTPPTGLEDQVPLDIYEIRPYSVLTRRGYIFPGDEYEMSGEAFWFGMAHLLWAGRDGAVFLITYEVNDPVIGYSRPTCRWFAPVGDYR
jgi:hypothetical protein